MKILKQTDGNAMIEVSLILPIIILMMLSVLDIGLVLQQYMVVADSARAGAEYATMATSAADISGMQTTAINSAGSIANYNAVAAVICSCTPGGTAVSCGGSCPGNATPAQYAQVTVTATLPLIFGVRGLPASIPVRSVVKVRTAWTGGH